MRSFGEILASLREERGIYQKELAAILKVSVGTISNYENNIHFPDQEALIQLAEYFDVTIDYLLGRTPYRYNPEVLRQECVPGTTVSDVVEVIQHFNPKNMASLLDFVDLLQLREKAESSCSCSKFLSQILKIVVKNFSEIVPGKQTQKEGFRPLIF